MGHEGWAKGVQEVCFSLAPSLILSAGRMLKFHGTLLKCKDRPTPTQEAVTQITVRLQLYSAECLFQFFSSESMGPWVGSWEERGSYRGLTAEQGRKPRGLGGSRLVNCLTWKGSSLTSSLCRWGNQGPWRQTDLTNIMGDKGTLSSFPGLPLGFLEGFCLNSFPGWKWDSSSWKVWVNDGYCSIAEWQKTS